MSLLEVALDRCADHGVWFDADELQRVLESATKLPDMILDGPNVTHQPREQRAARVQLSQRQHERRGLVDPRRDLRRARYRDGLTRYRSGNAADRGKACLARPTRRAHTGDLRALALLLVGACSFQGSPVRGDRQLGPVDTRAAARRWPDCGIDAVLGDASLLVERPRRPPTRRRPTPTAMASRTPPTTARNRQPRPGERGRRSVRGCLRSVPADRRRQPAGRRRRRRRRRLRSAPDDRRRQDPVLHRLRARRADRRDRSRARGPGPTTSPAPPRPPRGSRGRSAPRAARRSPRRWSSTRRSASRPGLRSPTRTRLPVTPA